MPLILNQAQAEAVYSAMCALNNVGARISCTVQELILVRETVAGSIYVVSDAPGVAGEHHADQAAFATAYSLQ